MTWFYLFVTDIDQKFITIIINNRYFFSLDTWCQVLVVLQNKACHCSEMEYCFKESQTNTVSVSTETNVLKSVIDIYTFTSTLRLKIVHIRLKSEFFYH